MAGKMADTVVEVLEENGVRKERIGVDNFDWPSLEAFQERKINIVNGWPAMSAARVIKTPDEIELLKQASSIGDAAMWKIKYEWLKPGVREREIEAKVHDFMLSQGCEIIYDIIVASGGNTSPYRRWATDKMIRQGDLVIVDINAVGPSGYFVDFVRCFKCASKMTQQEIDLYREVYDSMYAGIEQLRPGPSSNSHTASASRCTRACGFHGPTHSTIQQRSRRTCTLQRRHLPDIPCYRRQPAWRKMSWLQPMDPSSLP
jgi:Xaa-Pro aminopeptidase